MPPARGYTHKHILEPHREDDSDLEYRGRWGSSPSLAVKVRPVGDGIPVQRLTGPHLWSTVAKGPTLLGNGPQVVGKRDGGRTLNLTDDLK